MLCTVYSAVKKIDKNLWKCGGEQNDDVKHDGPPFDDPERENTIKGEKKMDDEICKLEYSMLVS